jgi:RNA polymerase sigma factor (sigma-70 family)
MSFPTTRHTLLSRMRKGEDGAWSEFVRNYTASALAFLRHLGLDEADAEDVWQETLFKLNVRALQSYAKVKGQFRSWLMMALNSKMLDLRRRAGAAKRDVENTVSGNAPLSPDEPEGATLFDQLEAEAGRHYAEARRAVQERLDELLSNYPDEREKRAYLDRFWNDDGLTDEEIAARYRYNRNQLTYLRQKVETYLRQRWEAEA